MGRVLAFSSSRFLSILLSLTSRGEGIASVTGVMGV